MNKKIIKIILIFLAADLLVSIGVIIGLSAGKPKFKPEAVLVVEKEAPLGNGSVQKNIEDNYWNFVRKSYIIIGTAPNYQFYKIVSQVPRNEYDPALFYADGNGVMAYHDQQGNRISHIAVDVSAHQGNVDWQQLSAEGVEIAMIRAGFRAYGDGTLIEDKNFRTNVQGALEANIKVGVYFFTQAVNAAEGVEEANYVLGLISGYNITGPIAIDTEYIDDSEARAYDIDITSRTDAVTSFCDTIKQAGREPMIYANRNWFVQNLDMTRLGGYKLWVAHYTQEPDFPYLYNGWQYTEEGSLSGAETSIDMDVWFD